MENSAFVSRRERRLWAWALATVLTLYLTLGLAPGLSGFIRSQSWLGAFFVTGMLLAGAMILTRGLTSRPSGAEIAVALGVAAVYVLGFVRISIPEERTHLIEYGVVGVLVHEALDERARHGRRVPWPGLLAACIASLAGILDECLQALIPNRTFAWRDILFNVLAASMAVVALKALAWARRLHDHA